MPQLQIINKVPGFGERLGEALGGGISQGIGASLSNVLEQRKNQKALKGLEPLAKQLNIPEKDWQDFIKSGADPKFALDLLKLSTQQRQLEEYNKSLDFGAHQEDAARKPETESFRESSEATNFNPIEPITQKQSEPERATTPEKYSIKPVLATQQLPKPVSTGQIQAHSAARLQAKQLGFQQNKKTIESIDTESKKAKELRPLIKRAAQIVKKNGVGGLSGQLQETIGEKIPFLKTPDLAEFQRLQKEMTVGNFRTDFGARPAQSEFFYITDVYSRPGDTKEAILRKLAIEDWKSQIKEKRGEIKDELFSKYGEYPLNLNAMVEERLKPTYDKFLEQTGYNEWKKKQDIKPPVTDDIMREYLRKNENNPEKALESLMNDGYKVTE